MKIKTLILLLLIFVVLRIPSFIILPDMDAGIHMSNAMKMNHGDELYKDIWLQKPPGMVVLFAASFRLFGQSVLPLKIISTINLLLTCLSLYLLTVKLFGRRVALYSTVLFIAASSYLFFSLDGLDAEYFLLLPVLFGSFVFLRGLEEEKPWLVFLSGLLFGYAFFMKQVAVWNIIGIAAYAGLLALSEKKLLFYGKALLGFMGGVLLFQIIWVSHFIMRETFSEMMDCVIYYNLRYVGSALGSAGRLKSAVMNCGKAGIGILIIWLTAVPAFFRLFRERVDRNRLFVIVLVISSFLGVCNGMRFFGHYFLQAVPGICMLSALFLRDYLRERKEAAVAARSRRWKEYAAVAVITASVLNYVLLQGMYFHKYGKENPFYRLREVAGYVRANTEEKDSIYVWGSPAVIYFLSGKICPVRFCFLPSPLPVSDPRGGILKRLKESPPRMIVKSQARYDLPGMDAFLETNYRLTKEYEVIPFGGNNEKAFMQVYLSTELPM